MAETIQVTGNVAGSIVVGDNNFVVNTNHGTIVYQQATLRVQKRTLHPTPPRPPRGFVNRVSELGKLEAGIAASDVILLHAPDGLGKTTLLKQAANTPAAKSMPDGVILLEGVDVAGQTLGPDDIIQRLFDALFESNPPLKVNSTTARTYLSNTRPLVLFDEVALTPALQSALPDLFPQGALILAADQPAGGDFERISIKPLPRSESLALLAEKSGLTLNEINRHLLDTLCAYLNDIPLALIITGNVLRETAITPNEAILFLQSVPDSSSDVIRSVLDRVFSLAFSQLSDDEQKALSVAALTPSLSTTPEWLGYALGGVPVQDVVERLQSLGLLYANSPRLRLPAGFRSPASEQATKQIEEKALLTRLVDYLLVNLGQPEFLTSELGNFYGVLTAASQARQWQSVLRLGHALDSALTLGGLWDAWGRTLEMMLEAARQSGQKASEAWALHQMGTRLVGLGQKGQAALLLRQSLKLRQQIGDKAGIVYTQHNLNILKPVPTPLPVSKITTFFVTLAATLTLLLGSVAPRLIAAISPQDDPTKVVPASPSFNITKFPSPTFTPRPSLTAVPPDVSAPLLQNATVEPDPSYYGEAAEACEFVSTTTISIQVSDPSGVDSVWLYYSYESGELKGAEQGLQMEANVPGFYQAKIDHNANNAALNVFDGLDGLILWRVEAKDSLGNAQTYKGNPVALNYSRCDATAPSIVRAYALPASGTYGDFTYCGKGVYSSYMELHVILRDESRIQDVFAQYYYRGKNQSGPVFSLRLFPYKGDLYHYFNVIDHNTDKQAEKILKGSDGQFLWQVSAIDEFGNTQQNTPYINEMRYVFCPSPG